MVNPINRNSVKLQDGFEAVPDLDWLQLGTQQAKQAIMSKRR
jgi:hypothetical protein